RARQDCAESDHGGFRQKTAGAGARHQACAVSRIVALRNPLAQPGAYRAEDERSRGEATPALWSPAAVVGPPRVGAAFIPPLTADEAGQLKMVQVILIGLGAGAAAALTMSRRTSAAGLISRKAPTPCPAGKHVRSGFA